MLIARMTITKLSLFALLKAAEANACPTTASPVTDADLANPPNYSIAFQGTIMEITPLSMSKAKSVDDFRITYKVGKVFQGKNLDGVIRVAYGPCHNLPGNLGDVINVLAFYLSVKGWYAPQFWRKNSKTKSHEPSCKAGTTVHGYPASDGGFSFSKKGDAYFCKPSVLIPLGL